MADKQDTVRLFIGFDSVESVAAYVFAHSVCRRSSLPVSVSPVMLRQLRHVLTRERDPKQSNDFSFSRWLVPWMCGYEGWAIFADCDMMARADIAELWALRDDRYAVQVVKHNIPHDSVVTEKYLGRPQTAYYRKNWSSVMLMNCARCTALTPDYVNSAHGLDLHQFAWCLDAEIGELPAKWNHLVGVYGYKYTHDAAIVHWTIGGPYFHDYALVDYADEWAREYRSMTHCSQIIDEPPR